MISIKRYLESNEPEADEQELPVAAAPRRTGNAIPIQAVPAKPNAGNAVLPTAIESYRSALLEMGKCSQDACPALGPDLKRKLTKVAEKLVPSATAQTVDSTARDVREHLQAWGKQTADHYQQKTEEIKGMLLVMAGTAQSVGERDRRTAGELNAVTSRLQKIATLEDLSQMRASIEASAADLKVSVDRMTTETNQVLEQMQSQLAQYQERLEKVEELASRDGLTGLRNRVWIEAQLQRRIASRGPLSVAIVDIDGFKGVNDEHGHLVGDEVLLQFASELQSTCRSTDLTGRWGGDEFILVMDCGMAEAQAKVERLRVWVCGSYKVQGRTAPLKLGVEASIGVAEHKPNETMKELIARADAAMYVHKAASRATRGEQSRSTDVAEASEMPAERRSFFGRR